MASPRVRALPLLLAAAALLARAPVAWAAADVSAEGSVADLVAKLDPSRPDPVRLQAVVLLGHLGGDEALQAVARALVHDPYPPVRSSAALALGQSGDLRWVRLLTGRLADDAPLARKAVRLAIKSLVKAFREQEDRLSRYTYRVDVRGLKDRSGADDNDLTVWFQEGPAERLVGEPRVKLGEILDLEPDAVGEAPSSASSQATAARFASALSSASARRAGKARDAPAARSAEAPDGGADGPDALGPVGELALLLDGGVLEFALTRDDEGARVMIRAEMQAFLEPVHEPLCDRKEVLREELLPADVSRDEAIEAVVLPLSRDLFDEIWTQLK